MSSVRYRLYGAAMIAVLAAATMVKADETANTTSTANPSAIPAKTSPAKHNTPQPSPALGLEMAQHGTEIQTKATAGDADSQFKLALAYQYGSGVTMDHAQAASWMRKALVSYSAPKYAGNADAEYKLGSIYAIGVGVPKNMQQATGWWEKSAEHGSVQGQIITAAMYINGNSEKHDIIKADKWLRIATLSGARMPIRLDDLEKTMKPQEIAKATAEADAWKAAHPAAVTR